jgi:uncharacterized membrane protein
MSFGASEPVATQRLTLAGKGCLVFAFIGILVPFYGLCLCGLAVALIGRWQAGNPLTRRLFAYAVRTFCMVWGIGCFGATLAFWGTILQEGDNPIAFAPALYVLGATFLVLALGLGVVRLCIGMAALAGQREPRSSQARCLAWLLR